MNRESEQMEYGDTVILKMQCNLVNTPTLQ